MSSSFPRRRWLRLALLSIGSVLPGCGTIFYPERRGQPAGKLDWKVVAFDGIGLVLFLVPGIIAFAVDFATGAIYLPPDHYGKGAAHPTSTKLSTIRVPQGKVDRQNIEHTVSQHVGKPVALVDGEFQTCALESIDQFWETHDTLAADVSGATDTAS